MKLSINKKRGKGCVYLLWQQEKKLDGINQHRESRVQFLFNVTTKYLLVKRGCIQASKKRENEKLTPSRQNRFYGGNAAVKSKDKKFTSFTRDDKILFKKNKSIWIKFNLTLEIFISLDLN